MAGNPFVYVGAPGRAVLNDLVTALADPAHLLTAEASTPTSHIAAALLALRLTAPPTVMLDATAAPHAATLGSALRAARTPARHYLLLDPMSLPQTRVGDYDWPDAPITVLLTGESPVAAAAQLRGWSVVTCETEHLADVVAELLS